MLSNSKDWIGYFCTLSKEKAMTLLWLKKEGILSLEQEGEILVFPSWICFHDLKEVMEKVLPVRIVQAYKEPQKVIVLWQ